MEEMWGTGFAAVNVDVGPERRSPRYHETCLALDRLGSLTPRVGTRFPAKPANDTRAKARCSVGAPEMAKRRSPSAEDLRKMGNVRVPSDWQPFGGFNDYARSFYPFWAAPHHMTRSHSHARSLTRGA